MPGSQVVLSRKHPFLVKREAQLILNRKAVDGGKDYISARLVRAPNESDISWFGRRVSSKKDVSCSGSFGMVGRAQRTAYVNDAGRVCGKIQQYIFKEPVSRTGADESFVENMGGIGEDALSFWMDVNELFTTQQWVWIQASRDNVAVSLGKRSDADRVKWTAYPSVSVPDWNIDASGRINWLIVETAESVSDDPFSERSERTVRTLWRRLPGGGVSMQKFSDKDEAGASAQWMSKETVLTIDDLPFVLVGKPSPRPWWFDDVEMVQSVMLNLDSINIDNMVRSVFPQLVVSEGTFENLQAKLVEQLGAERGEVMMQVVKEIIRGADTPIVETPEEKGTSRYICPSNSDLKALPEEIARKRGLLFDNTGLSLFNKETRMTQTAESKQFDLLDTNSMLKNRSLLMQKAERKLVEMSKLLDPNFKEYEPVWPVTFDVENATEGTQVVSLVANLPDATDSMRKLALKSAVRLLSGTAGHDQKLIDAANKEIDEMEFEEPEVEDPYLAGGDGGRNESGE